MSVGRKVFHCVVDETCLTTNLGEIKKWTSQDAIALIVPLYTLERLHILKKGGSQSGINAREAVRFLDRVTSGKHNISAEKVTLQGPMEQFSSWGDAEKYILPEFKEEAPATPAHDTVEYTLKEEKSPAGDIQPNAPSAREINDMSQMLLSKLNFKKDKEPCSTSAASAGTSSGPASPTSGGSRASPECSSRQLENDAVNGEAAINNEDPSASVKYVAPAVPNVLKPLLNAVLWRLHALPTISAPQSSCILVTNDRETQVWAQKFGIIVKNIAQLRTSIIYEEKEFKNHCKYMEKNQKENPNQNPTEPKPLLSYEDESDEDVLVFVPRKQGKAGQQTPARTPVKNTPGRGNKMATNNSTSAGRPRAPSTAAETTPLEVPSAPIDPDSFSRSIGMTKQNTSPNGNPSPTPANRSSSNPNPRGNGNRRGGPRGGGFRGAARGRGKLWVP
ncbi:uncharacterized protein ARB_06247 [Trichophyton benhamiae CBS 112371]|uniref:PIN domain-containing protein n=1 Tax=Arthroderma benhamiae (strain ATCC MYA-4681 / CBS 112371) TaxID=663331 RepID=D4APS9_ARTBC|nr:uncharacterized protein ARB_06247 [Trichophyton benhamiae CBS 112371]EFE35290.1 conserved hypothetical protein [Trichophyton benhamiae CBS 112371]